MNIDALIYRRKKAKEEKHWVESDYIRNLLDERRVFIFDHPDGSETIYHYPESIWRHKDRFLETKALSNRQYAELLFQRERRAEKRLDAWVFSNK